MVIIWHQPEQGTIIGEIHHNCHIIIKMSLCLVMLSMKSPIGNESTTVEWATLDTIDVTFVAQIHQAVQKRQNGFSVICQKKTDFAACFWGLELMWNQYSHASWAKPVEGNCPFWMEISNTWGLTLFPKTLLLQVLEEESLPGANWNLKDPRPWELTNDPWIEIYYVVVLLENHWICLTIFREMPHALNRRMTWIWQI